MDATQLAQVGGLGSCVPSKYDRHGVRFPLGMSLKGNEEANVLAIHWVLCASLCGKCSTSIGLNHLLY